MIRGLDSGSPAAGGAVRGPPRWSERGAAVVELLVVFLTLMVPLVYVMVVMADVQRALLATSSAAREAGRVYVTGSDRLDAERRAGLAYREVLATYGWLPGPEGGMELRVGCPAASGPGWGRPGWVGLCRWVRAGGGGAGGGDLSRAGGSAAVPGAVAGPGCGGATRTAGRPYRGLGDERRSGGRARWAGGRPSGAATGEAACAAGGPGRAGVMCWRWVGQRRTGSWGSGAGDRADGAAVAAATTWTPGPGM